jgi:hypothetical protein
VTRELALLVSAVIRRLAELKVVGTSLEKEWSAIQDADEAEQQYCLAAARLGLDPYAEAPQYEAGILRASEAFSGHLLTDFLDSVDPENIDSAIEWVRSARESPTSTAVHDQRESLHALRVEIQRHSGIEPALPWRQGWRQAHLVRDTIGATDTEKIDLSSYVVGIPGDPVDRGLLAVGAGSDNVDPKIVVDRHRARGRAGRFTLGRALWHRVWESEPVFLVTTAYTDRQKVERAFAAELLAPAAGIARLLDHGPELASPEDLEQVADHFDVSSMVVQHQLQNQLLTTRPG